MSYYVNSIEKFRHDATLRSDTKYTRIPTDGNPKAVSKAKERHQHSKLIYVNTKIIP